MDKEASANAIKVSNNKRQKTENVEVNGWENMNTDILMRIFQNCYSIDELATSGIARVCRAWREVCCDPLLWNTLDLSHMKSVFIKTRIEPFVYVQRRSDEYLLKVLKLSMSLSKGNSRTLVFHYNLYLTDHMLTYTLERCPNLRRLVLPAMNRFTKTGISKAFSFCKDLESLTMPSTEEPFIIFSSIGKKERLRELKVMGHIGLLFALNLVHHLPNLRVLSLRCNAINRDALLVILDELKSLEVLNISHSYLVVEQEFPLKEKILRELDEVIMKKALKLKWFVRCMEYKKCGMCERTHKDEGLVRWYTYDEGLWKDDEVSSLHL